jgi:hypothetical protein
MVRSRHPRGIAVTFPPRVSWDPLDTLTAEPCKGDEVERGGLDVAVPVSG